MFDMEFAVLVALVWALLAVIVVGVLACMGRAGHLEELRRSGADDRTAAPSSAADHRGAA